MEASGAAAAVAALSDGASEDPEASVVVDSSGDDKKVDVEKDASSVLVKAASCGEEVKEEETGQGKEAQQPSAPAKREEASWDPLKKPAKSAAHPWSIKRIKRDLKTLLTDPLPGIFVHVDESDMTVMHALVSGPFETPYEGGFFYFYIRFPDEYPNIPPMVRLMTTGGGRTRFNPNLYQCGKVCLSILGTWEGPSWSPSQTLSTVLLSIQSLMSSAPYHQEPGFETERCTGDSQNYNQVVEHETLRVAVCDMMEGKVPMPAPLDHVMRITFESLKETYIDRCKACKHRDGHPFMDPFRVNVGNFCYSKLQERLNSLGEPGAGSV